MVFTRNQVLLADSSGQTSPDVADYPMLGAGDPHEASWRRAR